MKYWIYIYNFFFFFFYRFNFFFRILGINWYKFIYIYIFSGHPVVNKGIKVVGGLLAGPGVTQHCGRTLILILVLEWDRIFVILHGPSMAWESFIVLVKTVRAQNEDRITYVNWHWKRHIIHVCEISLCATHLARLIVKTKNDYQIFNSYFQRWISFFFELQKFVHNVVKNLIHTFLVMEKNRFSVYWFDNQKFQIPILILCEK